MRGPLGWLAGQVRGWVGPDPATQRRLAVLTGRVVALNARNEQLTRQLDRERDDNEAALARADDLWRSELEECGHALQAARALAEHREPATGECRKVRLRDQAEAETFARAVEHSVSAAVGALTAYECRVCPRLPTDATRRYWHIGNADPRFRTSRHREGNHRLEERRERGRELAATGAETLARRLGPDRAAELRARVADRTVPPPVLEAVTNETPVAS